MFPFFRLLKKIILPLGAYSGTHRRRNECPTQACTRNITAVHVGLAPTPQATNSTNRLFSTLELRRTLEPKCVPQWFLGSLLGTWRSAIGQFFPVPGESPRSLCEGQLGPVSLSNQKWRNRVDVAPPAIKLRRRKLVSKTTYAYDL